MESAPSLLETLERLETLIQERNLDRSTLLNPADLAVKTALSEQVVRMLLQGDRPPADTVNERVRARIKTVFETHLARTGRRRSDLVGGISRELGISGVWARHICSGEKMPSVELLRGLVDFFRIEGEEAFFTAPAPEALNRALLQILATQEVAGGNLVAAARAQFDDVRGVALRQAHDLPPERWKVLNATLNALLELDGSETEQ